MAKQASTKTDSAKTEYDVFISYSRHDKSLVKNLWAILNQNQYKTWVDWDDIPPSAYWRQEIEDGIMASHNFLAILSDYSLSSVECKNELDCAVHYNKRLIPIILGQVDQSLVPSVLTDLNWIFFNKEKKFEASMQELQQALAIDLDYARVHTRLLARTNDWKQHDQDASYLLRGSELERVGQWIVEEKERTPKLTSVQRTFVMASQNAEKERQATLARNQRRRFIAVAVGLVNMVILAGIAEASRQAAVLRELKALSSDSQAQFALGNTPAALDKALQAGIRLDRSIWMRQNPELRQEVVSALGQAFYGIHEFNRIENPVGWLETVSYSRDDTILAIGGEGGNLWVWSPGHEAPEPLNGHLEGVVETVFSDNSQLLASADLSGEIFLWQRQGQTWQQKTSWSHGAVVRAMIMDPGNQFLIAAGDDGQIRIWNLDGTLEQQWQAHEGSVSQLRWHGSGQIVSVGMDGRVAIWQPQGDLAREWTASSTPLHSLAISPEGKHVITGDSEGDLSLWNWDGTQLETWQGHEDEVWDIEFTPDGQRFITVGEDRLIKIWHLDGSLAQALQGHHNHINDVSLSTSGEVLASASNDRTARLWQLRKPYPIVLNHSDAIYRIAYNSTSQTLVSAGQAGTIHQWQEDSNWGTSEDRLLHPERVNGLDVSQDGQWLVSADRSGSLQLLNFDGQTVRELFNHNTGILAVAFSPDGESIMFADFEGDIFRLPLQGGQPQRWFTGSMVFAIRYSPYNHVFALGGVGETIHIWNAEDLTPIRELPTGESTNYDLAFSPDGQTIVAGKANGLLEIQTIEGKDLRYFDHGNEVWAVAFSPNGQQIASSGADGVIKLWDLDGNLQVSLANHQAGVDNLMFLDENRLVSASEDHTALIWDLSILNLDSLVTLSCDWMQDYLQTSPDLTRAEKTLCKGIASTQQTSQD